MKKKIREEMLKLMNQDLNWYLDVSSERYKMIRQLSMLLERNQTKNLDSLSKQTFLNYRKRGYRLKEIAEKYSVSVSTLNKWREKNRI